jgi:acyl-CoA synthetase (AMP-forming)/AMP-acid ligase II
MVNSATKTHKLTHILSTTRAKAVLTDAEGWGRVQEAALPAPPIVWTSAACAGAIALASVLEDSRGSHRPENAGIDLDLAAILFTSGSTGNPKGVMLTHRNLVAATVSVSTYLEHVEEDVILSVLPLSFGYGLCQLLTSFHVGARLVLERSFTYPAEVVALFDREQITGMAVVPTIAAILLRFGIEPKAAPRLRYLTTAGAAMPTPYVRQLRALWPQVRLYLMYGQTECIRISYLPPDEVDARPESVGRGMPNQEAYLVDEQGRRLPNGSQGELVVRGSHVMLGYWESPAETAAKLRPGPLPGETVLHTGDLFRTDAEGYLYFISRTDEIIKTRGEKVSPAEVEQVLYSIEGVAEAAAIGVPDEMLGQSVKAVIRLHPGAAVTKAQILRHCANNLENFMVPKHIEFRDVLPHTGNGKIAKRELMETATV